MSTSVPPTARQNGADHNTHSVIKILPKSVHPSDLEPKNENKKPCDHDKNAQIENQTQSHAW